MGRPKSGLWSHFVSLSHDEGELKLSFNASHKNSWCKYCIEHAIQEQLGNAEDIAEYDAALGVTSNHFRRQRRCMKDRKPIRGVNDIMARHIRECEHRLDSVNLSTIPAAISTTSTTNSFPNQSQLQPGPSQLRQSILQLQAPPKTFSKETKAEFHADFLRMWIAIGALYWSADQIEVQSFFEKWVGMRNPSRYQCQRSPP